jgi:hypothetical protein
MQARCRPRAGLLEFQLNAKSGGLPHLAILVSQFPKALQKRFTTSRREQELRKIIDDESKRGSKLKQVITNEY